MNTILLAQQPVIEHQERAVEELELIIPENMEEFWFRPALHNEEAAVILRHSVHLRR